MRTFEVRIPVQISTEELPLDMPVDDNFAATVFNAAMAKVERRGLMAVDIVEKQIDKPDVRVF